MTPEAIIDAGVVRLVEMFQSGRCDPVTAFEAYVAEIGARGEAIGAFNDLRLDEARADAEASTARWARGEPLSRIDGVPIGVKANIAVMGLPHHAGIGAYRDEIAPTDAQVVRRLKAAGAVILGTLNMHEGALGATTDNPFFGRTENPRRAGFTPGGSSGGSGAAVAAGLVAAALGSDTMGSIRIPSAYCGCVGHKPSSGLIPLDGVLALSPTLDHVGPHARTVADLFDLVKVMAGTPDATTCALELGSVTFGLWSGEGKVDVQPDVVAAFERAVTLLAEAGAKVRPASPPLYDYGADRRTGLLISEREAAAIHADRLAKDPEGFSEGFRKMMAWGARQPEADYQAALARLEQLRAAAKTVFAEVDFVLAPVAPQTAFRFGDPVPVNQADFTAWANLAGLPATAVMNGLSAEGLPIGLQVIGPPGLDQETLVAAREVERVLGTLLVAR